MSKKTKRGRPGIAMTVGIPTLIAAGVGLFGAKYFSDNKPENTNNSAAVPVLAQKQTLKDPVTIKVTGDPWSGYSTFRGEPRFTAALAKEKITVEYIDDEKYYDQNERMKALAAGDIDIALTTLDAYLQHGANHKVDDQYAGVIIFGIDESAGGDAIFMSKGRTSFDQLAPTDSVCFAEGTPSEHLWDFASLAFSSVGEGLKSNNGVVAKDCWDKLKASEVQVAVLWQPYTALAEREGYPKVFATGGQADDVIWDIAVANRDYAKKNPVALNRLAAAYFKAIQSYQQDVAAHGDFITKDCGPDCGNDAVLGKAVMKGIDFLTLEENLCLWFGQCGKPSKVPNRVSKTARLLVAKGKLDATAIPTAESIVDDSFLIALKSERELAAKLAQEISGPDSELKGGAVFAAQAESYEYQVAGAESDATADIGTLKLPLVYFAAGSYGLGEKAKASIVQIADRLRDFPALCVRIYGHTNSKGDPQANRSLSYLRAEAISSELTRVSPEEFPKSRFDVKGFGSTRPVMRKGIEDMQASRRTEFRLFKCEARLAR